MYGTLLIFIAAFAVGILQGSFVTALPHPLSSLQLPLVLLVGLVTLFRHRQALMAAFVAGITIDALSALPNGTHAVTLALLTVATIFLFNRVFTHHSWLGTVGLNAASYLLWQLAFVVVRVVRSVFSGVPYSALPTGASLKAFFAGLAVQIGFVIFLLAVNGGFRRAFTRRFFLLR